MAKEKSNTIYEMAEKLGIKKESLELGLKKDKNGMEDMVQKAYKKMYPKER